MFLICDMFTFVLFAFHHLSFFLFNFISHYALLCFSYTISPCKRNIKLLEYCHAVFRLSFVHFAVCFVLCVTNRVID